MAGNTIEVVPGEEFVEIDLPEGVELPEQPTSPDASIPAPPPPPAPATPKEGNLGVALQQERAKARNYKQLWKEAEEKIASRKAETRSAVPQGPALQVKVPKIVFNTEALRARADAEAGTTMGAHAEMVVKHVEEVLGRALTDFATDLGTQLTSHSQLVAFNAALEGQKAACRLLFDDYDQVIDQAGFNQELDVDPRTNQFRNPELAAEVYRNQFPELQKYLLAKGRLEARAPAAETPAVAAPAPVAAPSPGPPAAPPPAPAPASAPEPESLGGRPPARGIRRIVSAGHPPRTAITRAYLDWLLDHDYPLYHKLTTADPRLQKFHLGGIPLDQAG